MEDANLMKNKHVVLLGDSIFDNARYVAGGASVIQHLQSSLTDSWSATLLAVDGNLTRDVAIQATKLPSDVSHLVISIGGNDALATIEVLRQPVTSVVEALDVMATVVDAFRADYKSMLGHIVAIGRPVTVCTIYDSIPGVGPAIKKAIALFNDVIIQEAFELALPILDLRSICTEDSDYSADSPIEPSHFGGQKIAREIACRLLGRNS